MHGFSRIFIVIIGNTHIISAECIFSGNRIIPTISKHIIAQDALAGGGEGIGIDESACCGVVIAGLAVIQFGFIVVDVAPVAEGVQSHEIAVGDIKEIAPGVIFVDALGCAAGGDNSDHIALQVQNVVEFGSVVGHRIGLPVLVIGKVHDCVGTHRHPYQLVTHIVIGVLHTVHSFARPQSVCTISIADIVGAVGCAGQFSSMLPAKGPPGAVVVAGGVAVGVLGQPWNQKIPWP